MIANTPITDTVGMLVQKAKIAQLDFEKYNQEQVNEVVTAVAWAICNPLNNKLIAELSVTITNLGKIEDKVIKNTDTAEDGAIVVALVDDQEATLKRLRRKGSSVALEAANSNYETRIFGPDRVKVQGHLIGILRRY